MAIVFADNLCVNITSSIDSITRVLPVTSSDRQKLRDILTKANDYTYLTLTNSRGSEIVKVYFTNGVLYMDRAQGGSTAQSFAINTCACFKVNKLVMDEYVTNIQEPCKPTIVSDDLEIIAPEGESCEWTINFTEDFKDRLSVCCPEEECPGCSVPDGTYENATITIQNGRICMISNGRNIVYTGGSCCNCTSE